MFFPEFAPFFVNKNILSTTTIFLFILLNKNCCEVIVLHFGFYRTSRSRISFESQRPQPKPPESVNFFLSTYIMQKKFSTWTNLCKHTFIFRFLEVFVQRYYVVMFYIFLIYLKIVDIFVLIKFSFVIHVLSCMCIACTLYVDLDLEADEIN